MDKEEIINNDRILYITGVIIFIIIVIWIVLIIFTRDNSINIIGEMEKSETQVMLAL